MFARLASKFTVAFSTGWDFFRPRKRLGIVSFVLLSSLMVVLFFVTTKIVHADILPSAGDIMKWFAEILLALAGFCIKLTFFVLKFIIEVAGYNGFIDSPAVIVGWVMIRDITNMLFVVVLLAIAFGTILGIDSYEYKHSLVKLIGAAILVNFSRVICGLIIDIAQVIMITFVNGIAATASGNLLNMFQVDQIFKMSAGGSTTGTPAATFLAGVAALTFSVIMLVTMLAFLFMILARMVMLWILIALSPFAFVLKILHKTEHYAEQWWSQFGNNVISGPIIAFFLWLSFVTVGSGTIHDEIKQNNALDRGLTLETVSPEEETVGITSITSWDKMANFIIAVAILLAAAKVAGELGVMGAGMMSSAAELGKKAAMYASGYKAARWLAPKVAMKFPVIGGDSWKRRGKKIAAMTSYGLGKVTERRDIWAKKLEESGKKGGFAKKMFSGLLMSAVESDGRKDKRVEDWEKAAKLQHEIVEENYSVSSDSGGQAKLKTDIRLKRLMKQAEGKKKEKYAKEEERMTIREEIFHAQHELEEVDEELKKFDGVSRPLTEEEDKKYNEKIAKKEHYEDEIIKLRAKYEAKFKAEVGRQRFDDEMFAKRGHAAIESKAKGANIEQDLHRAHEVEEAEARDKLAGLGGGGYVDQVRAKHAKEDQERAAIGSYDKSMAQLEIITKALANPKLSDLERDRLLRNRNNLQMANIKRGQMFGVNGQSKILGAGGMTPHDFTADLTSASLLAQQANFLSTQLNKQVAADAAAVSHALEELAEVMGPGYMEQMVDSLNAMADDGASGFAGMFKTRIDPKTNHTKVLPTRIITEEVEEVDAEGNKKKIEKQAEGSDFAYIQGKRDWAVSQSKLGKVGFEGSIDSENGKAMIKSAKALENVANMFAGLNRNNVQRVDANAIGTLVNAIKNSNDKGARIMEAIAKQANQDGVEALLKRINQNLVYQNEQIIVASPPQSIYEQGKKGKDDGEE